MTAQEARTLTEKSSETTYDEIQRRITVGAQEGKSKMYVSDPYWFSEETGNKLVADGFSLTKIPSSVIISW